MNCLRRCSLLAVTLLLFSTSVIAQNACLPGDLLARTTRAKLEVVFGRIQLTNVRFGKQSVLTATDDQNGVEQQLSFSARSANSARLWYQYVDDRRQLIVNFDRSACFVITEQPRHDSDVAAVCLRQPLRGPLVLTVDGNGQAHEIEAASFWHLMLAEPELCQKYVVPILRSLRTDWRLDVQAQQIRTTLLEVVRDGHLPDACVMNDLVQQLNHPKFSMRQAADHRLREMGQTAFAFLDRLDECSLDVEQRTRVRRIKHSLQTSAPDTPIRVAAWLADDKAAWLSLLESQHEEHRQIAASQLQTLAGRQLAFDPAASSSERRAQILRLRARLGLGGPILVGDAGERLNR